MSTAKTTSESSTQRHEAAALAAEAKITDPAHLAADPTAGSTTVTTTDVTTDEYVFDDVENYEAAEKPVASREMHSDQQTVEEGGKAQGDDGAMPNQALCHYIDAKAEELSQEKDYDNTIQESVVCDLQTKGDGTFLWPLPCPGRQKKRVLSVGGFKISRKWTMAAPHVSAWAGFFFVHE